MVTNTTPPVDFTFSFLFIQEILPNSDFNDELHIFNIVDALLIKKIFHLILTLRNLYSQSASIYLNEHHVVHLHNL